jgi:hypothetical protein
MIWLFERGNEVVRLETRVDNTTGEYVLVSTWSDSSPRVERFRVHAEYEARILALESQLAAEHWTQVGSPTILPHGWRGPVTN